MLRLAGSIRFFSAVALNFAFIWAFSSAGFFWLFNMEFKTLYSTETYWTPGFLMFLGIVGMAVSFPMFYIFGQRQMRKSGLLQGFLASQNRFPFQKYIGFVIFSTVLFLGVHAYWVREWGEPGTTTFKWALDTPWTFIPTYVGMHTLGTKLGFWSDDDE
jgi:hypothetical protein